MIAHNFQSPVDTKIKHIGEIINKVNLQRINQKTQPSLLLTLNRYNFDIVTSRVGACIDLVIQ